MAVAVGTIIAGRPPHRSVRALLRIRLPPRMASVKALHRIRMENASDWNPSVCEPVKPVHGEQVLPASSPHPARNLLTTELPLQFGSTNPLLLPASCDELPELVAAPEFQLVRVHPCDANNECNGPAFPQNDDASL